jgi:hypothetical protein
MRVYASLHESATHRGDAEDEVDQLGSPCRLAGGSWFAAEVVRKAEAAAGISASRGG